MEKIIFDFNKINTPEDFYQAVKYKLNLPEYFGNNLDALWDCITGGNVMLPVDIEFIDMSMTQLEKFSDVIILFEDAVVELKTDLLFSYSLKK